MSAVNRPETRLTMLCFEDGEVIIEEVRRCGENTEVLSFNGRIDQTDGTVSISGAGDERLMRTLAANLGAGVQAPFEEEGKVIFIPTNSERR